MTALTEPIPSTSAEHKRLPELVRSYLAGSLPAGGQNAGNGSGAADRGDAAAARRTRDAVPGDPGLLHRSRRVLLASALPDRRTPGGYGRRRVRRRQRPASCLALRDSLQDDEGSGDGRWRGDAVPVRAPLGATGHGRKPGTRLAGGRRAHRRSGQRQGATAVVELQFDTAGDIVQATGTRPFPLGKTFVPTPWGGDFSDYASLNGTRIPTHGQAWWELPEGRFIYWRGHIDALELIEQGA